MRFNRVLSNGLAAWELLAVIALVTALAFLLMRLLVGGSIADQRSLTISRLLAISEALDKYAIDNGGQFPTTDQGLAALLQPPTTEPQPRHWQGPYLPDAAALEDAWGRQFHYVQPGGGEPPRLYDLWSLGADGAEEGSGVDTDILSWDRSTTLP